MRPADERSKQARHAGESGWGFVNLQLRQRGGVALLTSNYNIIPK
jgi:hypothetical protein